MCKSHLPNHSSFQNLYQILRSWWLLWKIENIKQDGHDHMICTSCLILYENSYYLLRKWKIVNLRDYFFATPCTSTVLMIKTLHFVIAIRLWSVHLTMSSRLWLTYSENGSHLMSSRKLPLVSALLGTSPMLKLLGTLKIFFFLNFRVILRTQFHWYKCSYIPFVFVYTVQVFWSCLVQDLIIFKWRY